MSTGIVNSLQLMLCADMQIQKLNENIAQIASTIRRDGFLQKESKGAQFQSCTLIIVTPLMAQEIEYKFFTLQFDQQYNDLSMRPHPIINTAYQLIFISKVISDQQQVLVSITVNINFSTNHDQITNRYITKKLFIFIKR